jgi:transposase
LAASISWIKPALAEYGIPYHEAIAVVFPELVRYSALRDKMENYSYAEVSLYWYHHYYQILENK